ncbi:MAG: endonuclease/exonuclease/phosphatase family protein [Pirellulales bacterium]
MDRESGRVPNGSTGKAGTSTMHGEAVDSESAEVTPRPPRVVRSRRYYVIRGCIVVAALLVVPYLTSRALSPWRCVRTIETRPVTQAVPPSRRTLRVLTYNIAHGRGLSPSNWQGGNAQQRLARLDAIAALLVQQDADIVILNEADFESPWSHSVDQAAYLAERAGYPYCAEQRNVDFRVAFWPCRFGNAVLSRFPIEAARVVALPGNNTWQTVLGGKKQALACDVKLADRTVQVIAVHLYHADENVRTASTGALIAAARSSPFTTLVAGDLNSTPPDFPWSQFDQNGRNAVKLLDESQLFQRRPMDPPTATAEMTFHATEPRSVIDWILIPTNWKFVRYEVFPSELSDHRPVMAEVEY